MGFKLRSALTKGVGAFSLAIALTGAAYADDPTTAELKAQIDALRQIVIEQQNQIRSSQQRMDVQQRQIDAQARVLQAQGQALSRIPPAPGIPGAAPGGQPGAGPAGPGSVAQAPPAPPRPPTAPPAPPTRTAEADPTAPETLPAPGTRTPPAAPQQQAAADGTGDRANSERQADQLLVDAGGVLLPRGTVQIEPSFDWTSISSDRVNIGGFTVFNAIVIGQIRVDDIQRNIYTTSLAARAGLGRRLQVEGRMPYQWRDDREILGVGTGADERERSVDAADFGDFETTFSWQPLAARGWIPATITRVRTRFPTGESIFEIPTRPELVAADNPATPQNEERFRQVPARSPTGSGFYAVSPGVTMVWRADPVVLFAGGGYTEVFGRNFDRFGKIDPGGTIDGFMGFNLALNERVSFTSSFVAQNTYSTRNNGVKALGTSSLDARLSFGSSIGLTDNMSLVVSAQTGLTDQSPDFGFSLSLPITLQNFF
jgi:hypothetical protein